MYIIAGLYRHRRLISPKGTHARPTASRLRESLFNICQGTVQEARFLDLFAGSGAIGLEALSRGAQFAAFVDSHKESIRCIQQNISLLNVQSHTRTFHGHVLKMLPLLEAQQMKFDIIFADPPYKTPWEAQEHSPYYSEAIVNWIDQSSLLVPGGTLFIEEAFEVQPDLTSLKTLKLINSRKMGCAALQQYERIK